MPVEAPEEFDFIVIGGGIVGIATAWQLIQKYPERRIALLEKESSLASHQTGHNSGVIHAGVYYTPGSLKADLCKRGNMLLKQFCTQHQVPIKNCGKLLVATNKIELERMNRLYQRCLDNGIKVSKIDKLELQALEPNIQGESALHIEATSIVDFRVVSEKLAESFIEMGGEVFLNTEVTSLNECEDWITIAASEQGNTKTIRSQFLITCAGLMSDRVAKMLDIDIDFQIIPYRGEYFKLAEHHNSLVNHLIYPIPDPDLPFLGVHITKMIDGSVTVGPNAVQGWKREGYGDKNFSVYDAWEMLTFSGFWRATLKHFVTGLKEYKNSWCKKGYLKLVHKYCPTISLDELQPHPAGVRAQAVMSDGSLVHDFLFAESRRSLHVCNAPSPAATSSIAIGEHIMLKLGEKVKTSE
ncbi:L-2-hydroxyglutarate oxidase [Vibrio sp. S4M6]|uniref:L-2-hydroxyglutarate oxidase n=1 Tax=Vibrio sinus TaxID=2946865 RepID=UPI002029DA09|nr:L-2-hydroxyglutarate oxidase [Vibrio sinus]MCL9779988.1 L-2-hydroxyglutarate oxidase [Vibrio sinus]